MRMGQRASGKNLTELGDLNGAGCGSGGAAGSSGGTTGEISELSDDQLEESPVEGGGIEPDKYSCSKRASLDSIAASRAFSLLSCSVSLLSCNICCS
jgi:hypothetical protein